MAKAFFKTATSRSSRWFSTSSIAEMLRGLDFEVWEQPRITASMSLVTGWWSGAAHEQCVFQYAHHPAAGPEWWGGCSLAMRPAPTAPMQDCFTMKRVRCLRDVRLLLENEWSACCRVAQRHAVPPISSDQ